METRRRRPEPAEATPFLQAKERRRKARKPSCLCRCCIGLCLTWAVLIAVTLLVYHFAPCPIIPLPYQLPEPPNWDGPLSPNSILESAHHVLSEQLAGPESFILLPDGDLLTGLKTGEVVLIRKDEIVRRIRFSSAKDCDGSYYLEEECGRPLGLRADAAGRTFVADAYLGLIRFDIHAGTHEVLVAPGTIVDGRPLIFFNDLDIIGDVIYFTVSSSRWNRRDHVLVFFEAAGDGRLLSYNVKSGELQSLVSGLRFANGVQTSPDGDWIAVTETLFARVHRYHLRGPQTGQSEVWVDNLPGFPDNIRLSANGTGLWVGYAFVRRPGWRRVMSFLDFAADKPWLRRFMTQVTPVPWFEKLRNLVHQPYGLATLHHVHTGRIISSLHDPTGKVVLGVSEVCESSDGRTLYLGHYYNPFLSRLHL